MPTKNQQRMIECALAILLSIGVLLSSVFVTIGDIRYLNTHTSDKLIQLQTARSADTSLKALLTLIQSHTAVGIMECGILILIATQILRVALLTLFYGITKELKFFIIGSYILLLLLHSFFYPHLTHAPSSPQQPDAASTLS